MTATNPPLKITLSLLVLALLSACSSPLFGTPTATATALPTNTPQPSATPTATPVPYLIPATVWESDLQVPILIYHRFGNESHDDNSMWVKQSTFKAQLQKLYDAGYSLIPLTSWLDGSFSVPAGRKPLILTIDDGWTADQLYINDDGMPADYSGIGMLWYFTKEHPDFGFAISINVIMGDKQYADLRVGDWNYVSEGDAWKTKLGETIAWALDNGVEVFNHTYTHVDLSQTDPAGIKYQLSKNDKALRYYLELVGREDLESKLENVIAAPQGLMPSTNDSLAALYNYVNPENKPVLAVLAAYNATESLLTPSVFSAGYDRLNLPRTTATNYSIDWVVSVKDQIPTAGECKLGPTDESAHGDVAALQALITTAVQSGTCPQGVYNVNGIVFVAKEDAVVLYK
jgi:peptidoglycan/xylan/chitin deacetylase (PgdA/CDA1 family)